MSRHSWKMVTVVEKYHNERGVAMFKLSCGHTKTDPIEFYGNESGWAIGRLANEMSGQPLKARCYKCATKE